MVKGRSCTNSGDQGQIESFSAYLQERELSCNTIQAYVTSIRQFFEAHSEVTKENGLAWKRELQEKGLAPKSINVRLNAYNAYCSMIGGGENKVKTMRVHQSSTIENVISRDEYQRLLDCLARDGNWRYYFGIKLLAMSGARISEFVCLKKYDLDRGYAEMWTKGKIRRIYIPKSFQNEAREYYRDFGKYEFLMQNKDGNAITSRGMSGSLQDLAERYGINKKVMHPHSFRHLFAIEFLQRNSNLTLLADVMGHSSVSTTAIYTRMTQEQQQSAVDNAVDW